MRKFAVVLVLVAIGVGSGLYFLQERAAEQSPIRVAFGTWVGFGAVLVAQEMGFYEAEGIEVDFQLIDEAAARRAALAAGQADVVGTTLDDVVVTASQGISVQAFLAADESFGADGVVATKEIESLRDLSGKKVAVQPGFVNHFFLLYLLDLEGIDSSELSVQPMEPDAAGLAFLAGQVEAAVTWEPHLSAAKSRPDSHLLASTRNPEARGVIADVFLARPKFLEENQRRARSFVIGTMKGQEFWKERPTEANEIIGRVLKLDAELVGAIAQDLRLLGEEENKTFMSLEGGEGTALSVASKAASIYQAEGFIDTSPAIENLITPRFLVESE